MSDSLVQIQAQFFRRLYSFVHSTIPAILVLNAGSSSVNWKLFKEDFQPIIEGGTIGLRGSKPARTFMRTWAPWTPNYAEEEAPFLNDHLDALGHTMETIVSLSENLLDIQAVGHRVVHG